MLRIFSALCVVIGLLVSGVSITTVQAAGSGGGGSNESIPERPGQAAFKQGKDLIEQKRYADAIVPLKQAVNAQPGNADYLTELAYASRKAGQRDASFEYYAAALKADPDHVGALNYLGMLYVETNRPHKAEKMLQKIDDECFFPCDEYTSLKAAIESGDTSAY